MAKDIKSSSSEWDALKSKWTSGSDIGQAIKYLHDAYPVIQNAIKEVNRINSQGYESIGSLQFSVTQGDLDQLEEGRRRLENFCAQIHEELVIDIDTPFARKMTHFADGVYSINPQQVVNTHKGVMDFKKLYDMVSPFVEDEDIEADFDARYQELQEVPSEQLQSTIVTLMIEMYEGIEVKNVTKEDKELLIKYYEVLHEEDAEKMDTFLAPVVTAGYAEDVMNIKFLSYKAAEPCKTILFHYLPEIAIEDCNWADTQHYHPRIDSTHGHPEKSMVLSMDKTRTLRDSEGSYFTVFHEIGHGIDDMMKRDGVFYSRTSDLQGKAEEDAMDNIGSKIEARGVVTGSSDYVAVLNSIQNNDITNLNAQQKQIYSDVISEYETDLLQYDSNVNKDTSAKHSAVTDVYGGFTNNALRLEKDGGYGHSMKDYWLKSKDAQSSELYASYFAMNITEYPTHVYSYDTYFPESTKYLDQRMEVIGDRIKLEL